MEDFKHTLYLSLYNEWNADIGNKPFPFDEQFIAGFGCVLKIGDMACLLFHNDLTRPVLPQSAFVDG